MSKENCNLSNNYNKAITNFGSNLCELPLTYQAKQLGS